VSIKTGKIMGVISYVKDAENDENMGYNDCDTDVPVVSTRISSYIDWIKEKTGLTISDDNENKQNLIIDEIEQQTKHSIKFPDRILQSLSNDERRI
jgi:secreted trypsin-like serine protease